MTTTHLVLFFLALGLSAGLTPLFISFFTKRQLAIATPRPRDVHTQPTPRLGGLVIAGSFWLVILGILLSRPGVLDFQSGRIAGIDRNLLGVLLGTLILALIGAMDDIRGLKPGWKLLWQAVAAAMLPVFGVRIQWLAHPFGGANIELPALLDGLLAILWIVLIINVLNFLDGLDGLATGVSSIALATLYLLALAPFVAQPALATLLIILLGASLGFLPWNWYPAKIFLGDSGSHIMGYLIGVAAIVSGGKLATAALVLSLPILDALWAIVRRLGAGRSPFAADRGHLHHRLLDLGLSQPVVTATLMTIAAIFGIIALSSRTTGKTTALFVASGLMIALLWGLTLWERKKRSAISDQR
ncbi:undecaprenyl/decaprenyl-phosphate alpha-N-acetylglucosaminyl 1-phosphate transferase [Candidatus Berkelbacteria bacterium]|nr:undecaprenyl/decaprenyl-phosphate alpha-N-acetylglucosaminyl 1-phosphate transferase [Candidatus Berkelbacteria bacterium]